MNTSRRLLLIIAALLLPAASFATNVPLPIENTTMNIAFYVQPQILFTENGTPDGQKLAVDYYIRRSRMLVNGDIADKFSYVFQVDNTNFGKFGNFTGRMIVQDAWFGWAPTGIKGGTVVYVDAGIVYYPFSRLTITSAGNQPTVEGHPDLTRGINATAFPANRTTGVDIRGWALNKKLGFRGGIFEGVQPIVTGGIAATTTPASVCVPPGTTPATGVGVTPAPTCLNPNRNPAFAGFVNFDILGQEEGGWLYQSIYWAKDPILSISLAGTYQSKALSIAGLGLTDQKSLVATLFLDFPLSEQQELVLIVGGYRYGNGSGSKDTGTGLTADLGFRFQSVRPYVSWEYFNADDCPAELGATGAAITACRGATGAHSADSRNFKLGLDYYINKTANHVQLELGFNRGQSNWGAQAVNNPVPAVTGLPITSLGRSPSHSLLLHWNVVF